MGVPKHEFDIDAHAQRHNRESRESGKLTWQAGLICFALFAAAPLFAVLTWQESYTWLAIRHYSIPIVFFEVVMITTAIAAGSRPDRIWSAATITNKLAFVLFMLAVIVSNSFIAGHRQLAIVGMCTTITHVVFFAVILERFRSDWRESRILAIWASAGGAAVYVIVVFALALSEQGNSRFNWDHFGPGVSNVRQLGYYGLAAAGLAAGLLAVARNRSERLASTVVLTLGIWCVLSSGGRAAAGALIALCSLTCVMSDGRNRTSFLVRSGLGFVVAAVASLAFAPNHNWGVASILGRLNPHQSIGTGFTSGRSAFWKETWSAILDRPLFGHGEQQFRFAVESARGVFNHPHNSVLQLLYEWGIVGTLSLAVLCIALLKDILPAVRTEPRLALPASAGACGLFAMSLLEGSLFHAYPIMIVLICSAIILSIKPKGHSNV